MSFIEILTKKKQKKQSNYKKPKISKQSKITLKLHTNCPLQTYS